MGFRAMTVDELYDQSLGAFNNPPPEEPEPIRKEDLAPLLAELAEVLHRDRIYFPNAIWHKGTPLPKSLLVELGVKPSKIDEEYLWEYLVKYIPEQPRSHLTHRQLHYLPEGLTLENGGLTLT